MILSAVLYFHFLTVLHASVTYEEITVDLKGDIQYYLHKIAGDFTPGNLVRYGFHTCVTGCDGCLNLNNPPNAGLEPSFDALNKLYIDTNLPSNITWNTKIENLADFWTICSTVGNLITIPDGSYVPEFKFWIGRNACATSPNQTIMAQFPDPILGLSAQTTFFKSVFNLSQSQYIALIGGHTLGFAHSYASGFDTLQWTVSPTVLDNTFYTELVGFEWVQQSAIENGLYEWEMHGSDDGYFMFNSDVDIYRNISDYNRTNGEVSCAYDTCPIRQETQTQIEMYVSNQTQWLNDYSVAWNTMMLAQCNVQNLTQILPI